MEDKKRVLQLIRVSTQGQADEDKGGVPAQYAANRRTAQIYNLEIVDTVELIDVSGTAVLDDPRFQHLLEEDLERDDIDGVVAPALDRVTRLQGYQWARILSRFQETDKILYLPSGPLDLGSEEGELMGPLQAIFAAREWRAIRRRLMGGKEALRRQGRWVAGQHQLPYAVAYDPKTYKFSYKPEAEKVREVFRRFLAGEHNYDTLSDYLGLSRGTAKNILQNEIYCGVLAFTEKRDMSRHGKRPTTRDRRKVARTEDELYRRKVIDPGLISDEDFARVQLIIAKKQELNIRQRQKIGEFVYNGFLWCSKCNVRIHTFRNQWDRFYYICSNKKRKDAEGNHRCQHTGYMNRDRLESQLDDLLSRTLTDPAQLERIFDLHCKELMSKSPQLELDELGRPKALVARYQDLHAKQDRLLDSIEDGTARAGEVKERLAKLRAEIRETERMMTQAIPRPGYSPVELSALFEPFKAWSYLGREAKRRVLNGLAPKFLVADYVIAGVQLSVVPESIEPDINRPNELKMGPYALRGRRCR